MNELHLKHCFLAMSPCHVTQFTDRKPGESRCHLFESKCTKSHLRASEKSKISPRVIHPDPVKGEGRRRERKGRPGKREREREEK